MVHDHLTHIYLCSNSSWYPYILISSSLFLCLTIGIYTYFDKLLNFYTRIMRHFAIALLAAFIVLAIAQFLNMDTMGYAFCKASGKISFLFMLSGEKRKRFINKPPELKYT